MEYLKRLTRRVRERAGDRGASLVEYALLVALIAVVCISAVTFLGGGTSDSIDDAGAGIGGSGGEQATGCPASSHRGTDSQGIQWFETSNNCYDDATGIFLAPYTP